MTARTPRDPVQQDQYTFQGYNGVGYVDVQDSLGETIVVVGAPYPGDTPWTT